MSIARALVEQASAVLLDFDGPVCSIFAGTPAAQVADLMRIRLAAQDPKAKLASLTSDPLEVLQAAFAYSADIGAVAERLLSTAELEAIIGAEPTDGASEFLEQTHQLGTPLAIVSNNSESAIRAYLERQRLTRLVAVVSARDRSDARLMKPHPRSLAVALSRLGCDPADAVMIGDSESDIIAARASDVRVVALANKHRKIKLFEALGADAVVASMRELVA